VSRSVRPAANHLGDAFEPVLVAARTGEGWAAERLWRCLAPAVAGYLRAQGASEPEDLTSEVFLGVFRTIGTFSGDEPGFRSWVFTIAHRRLVDDRRRASRRPSPSELSPGDADRYSGRSAEQEALRHLGTERVRELCDLLVPDQRDVLLLRLVAGLTVEEVAHALDKSEGAVKALQRRGLGSLRRILDRQGVPL
jgi:RNA polymerase sigma factor (sigma-70 family)